MTTKNSNETVIQVAFVIPFAFEKFFHYAYDLHNSPELFENSIISKIDTWHFNWCQAIKNANMNVTIYHLSMYGRCVREYTHKTGIKIIRVPINRILFSKKKEYSIHLLKRIKKDKPDVVFCVNHLFNPIIDMYDLLAIWCKLIKIPIVTRNAYANTYKLIFPDDSKSKKVRSNIYNLFRIFYQPIKYVRRCTKFFIKKISLSLTDVILIQTKSDIDTLKTKFKLSDSKLNFFPKPINLDTFYPVSKREAANEVKKNIDYIYLLHVSNLFNTKGCEYIITLLPDLLRYRSDIHLLISGDGPEKVKLLQLTHNLCMDKNVTFLGQVPHEKLRYYYCLADIFVLPTEFQAEGQPNVIIESLACNTIPITTDLPGPASIVTDGLGVRIKAGNILELRSAIIDVLDGRIIIDQEKRMELLSRYSLDSVGENLKKLFIGIINKKSHI